MADILPRDLQPVPGGTVLPGTVVIIDDGSGVYKASVEQVAATGTPLASSAEVFAGSSVQKYLNPERTVEAINTHSPVRSVNGQTGVVILTKADMGLGNVENIALSASSGASNIGTTSGQTVQEVIDGISYSQVRNISYNYTLSLDDIGQYIRIGDASPITITVPDEATGFFYGSIEWNFRAVGDVSFIPAAGVTINAPNGGTLALEDAMTVTLKRVGVDEFDLIGQTVTL